MASNEQITVVAIMTPHPGKMDRSIELLTQAAHFFRENEPGTIRYQLHVDTKGEDRGESLVFIETYENKPAWDAHCKGKAYQMLVKTITEQNLVANQVVKFIKPIAGWASK